LNPQEKELRGALVGSIEKATDEMLSAFVPRTEETKRKDAKQPKRGKRGQGSIYLPNNSRNWWIKFSISGRVIQKSAETESRRDALDFLKAEILRHASGEAVTDGKVTVDSLYDVLLADYRINEKTVEWAERVWRVHLKTFFGGMQAKNVGTDTLSRYIESRRKESAANGTINRELSLLQRSFMLAYESQPRKVAHPLRFHRLAESKPRQGFIEQKQYDALAANCSDLFMRTMLALAYSFGFRKAELLTLEVSDVNLLAGTLQLRDSKNGEPRKVSLTRDTRNLLTACCAGKSVDHAVFTRGSGNDVKDFRVTWDKITLAAGCSGLLFHDLRRSAVRNMVRAGIPEVVCMKVSGHKTRNVFDRYNITSERDLADAARKIEISQRQAKVAENAQETHQAEPVTIQ
jgi:integrase